MNSHAEDETRMSIQSLDEQPEDLTPASKLAGRSVYVRMMSLWFEGLGEPLFVMAVR